MRSITYTCPHCGTQMEVDPQFAGQRGPCAICAKIITIPATEVDLGAESHQQFTQNKQTTTNSTKKFSIGSILLILGLTFGGIVMITICSGIFYQFGVPAIRQAGITAKNQTSLDNLKQIYQAMESYHTLHGAYPPPYLADEKGKPMHSWRVLLLPHLGRKDLYEQYDFSKPWDQQDNLFILNQMPAVYQSFDNGYQNTGETRFVVITGKNSMFPTDKTISHDAISDDPQTVLMILETNGVGIDWLDPTKDLKRSTMTLVIQNDPENATSLPGTVSGNVVMANGDTHTLPDDTGSQLMQDMSSINGGEAVIEDLDLLINFNY